MLTILNASPSLEPCQGILFAGKKFLVLYRKMTRAIQPNKLFFLKFCFERHTFFGRVLLGSTVFSWLSWLVETVEKAWAATAVVYASLLDAFERF